jgi:hypothetical protein
MYSVIIFRAADPVAPSLLLTPTVMMDTTILATDHIHDTYMGRRSEPGLASGFNGIVQQQSDSRKTTAIGTADACCKVPGLASTYALQPSPTNAGSFL